MEQRLNVNRVIGYCQIWSPPVLQGLTFDNRDRIAILEETIYDITKIHYKGVKPRASLNQLPALPKRTVEDQIKSTPTIHSVWG